MKTEEMIDTKYGILAATRADSVWGRTERWRCDRYGRPLAFDTAEEALEAAKAFNDQRGPLCPIYDHAAAPLEEKEAAQWSMAM